MSGHGFGVEAVNFSEAGVGDGDPGRFVAFAAVGLRSEIGGVGFDEQAVEWDPGGGAAELIVFLVGEHTAEGDMQSQIDAGLCGFGAPAERVHDSAEGAFLSTLPEDVEHFVFGFAAVDDEGFAAATCELDVSNEEVSLGVERSVFPVEVESGFADADDLGVAGELFDLFPVSGLHFVGVVGVDSDDGGEGIVSIGEEYDGAA